LTQALDFERVKALSKAVDCTLNDVVLAIVGAALRRYLNELRELPKRSLTGGVPVGLKHEAGAKTGNNVSIIFATLGTDIEDPLERLMAVRTSTSAAKDHLLRLTDASRSAYSLMMLLPAIAGGALGSGRAMCNVPVSNVPGPRKPLYLAGAPIEAVYPTSVLPGNGALGITVVSYDRGLFVGIVACPDVLPHVQRLGPYIGEAFTELEAAVAASSGSKRAGAGEPAVAEKPRARRVAGAATSSKRRNRTVKSPARSRPGPATRARKGSASNRRARAPTKTRRGTRRR
jgi:WS/DGAT/MGAT family acyltransferase